jgi:hypothetical protein
MALDITTLGDRCEPLSRSATRPPGGGYRILPARVLVLVASEKITLKMCQAHAVSGGAAVELRLDADTEVIVRSPSHDSCSVRNAARRSLVDCRHLIPVGLAMYDSAEFASEAMYASPYQFGLQLDFIHPGRPVDNGLYGIFQRGACAMSA